MTELEFALQTAKALVSTLPDKATDFVAKALARTVDPRLRHLIGPALPRSGAMMQSRPANGLTVLANMNALDARASNCDRKRTLVASRSLSE